MQFDGPSHKRLATNSQLQSWHREKRLATLADPHRAILEHLLGILQNLKPESASIILAHIRGVDWSIVDLRTRQIVLHELGAGIIEFRTRHGLPPFDDPSNVFLAVKQILFLSDEDAAWASPVP